MKVKITPTSGSSQIVEFNYCLDNFANTAISPTSTLTINQRWAEVINTSTSSTASYVQLTKFDLVLNIQYVDTKGCSHTETHTTSTIISTTASSETATSIQMSSTKALDIIIPCTIQVVDQQIISQLPMAGSGKCAYSVFEIQQTPTSQPA